MANNPYVNKVQKADGSTLIDLTSDTATESDVLSGKYFHKASGERVQGSLTVPNVYDGLDSSSVTDALSANQGRILNDKIGNIGKQIVNGNCEGYSLYAITLTEGDVAASSHTMLYDASKSFQECYWILSNDDAGTVLRQVRARVSFSNKTFTVIAKRAEVGSTVFTNLNMSISRIFGIA